ncbi:MAG: response regulator [candidate division Zixibacteria bacterium]|nr:response regulator [candidate division Zixibacteria bacterium]
MTESNAGNILIVDDELRMCLSLKSLLERQEYSINTTTSSIEASELLQTHKFDMVITDIKMPEYDGIEILRKAKEIDPHIIVILMTGFASLESAKAAINRGAFDYLTKPLEFDDLIKSIRKGLAFRNAEIDRHHLLELLSESHQQLENRLGRLNALYKSAGVLSGTINLDTLLQQVINLVTGVVGTKDGSIMLLDKSGEYLEISAAISLKDSIILNTRVSIGEGVAGYVALNREPIIIEDISTDPRFTYKKRDKYNTTSSISTPIVHRDELLGVINLNNKEGGCKFDLDDLQLLETFASHSAIAIANARLFEDNQIKLKELGILHEIATRLSSSKSESEVFSSLFHGVKSIVTADFCYFFSIGDEDGNLKVTYAEDQIESHVNMLSSIDLKLPPETTQGVENIENRKWIEEFLMGAFIKANERSVKAFITVPVSVENSLSGYFCIGSYNGEKYSDDAKRLVSIIASQAASLYERQRSIINGSKLLTMGKMISELTHDLKKPLTNIKGSLQVLESKLDDKPGREEFLNAAIQEVDRLTDLVKEMLDFADPGKYKRFHRDIVKVVEKVLALLNTDIKKYNIKLTKEFDTNIPTVLINETEVFEAVLNILFNAVEAMPDGGILKISINRYSSEDNSKDYIRISITDEGKGIPENKINHIFERYYSLKEDGTGLGLALVKRVISSHSGEVSVKSELGKGTTFFLDFPTK